MSDGVNDGLMNNLPTSPIMGRKKDKIMSSVVYDDQTAHYENVAANYNLGRDQFMHMYPQQENGAGAVFPQVYSGVAMEMAPKRGGAANAKSKPGRKAVRRRREEESNQGLTEPFLAE